MIRESTNVYGTLRHERGVPGVADALAAQLWVSLELYDDDGNLLREVGPDDAIAGAPG